MATIEEQREIIEQGLREIEELLYNPTPQPEHIEKKTYEPDPQSVWIDEQIKEIEDSLYNPTRIKETNQQEEKKLLSLIADKETIIQFLTKQLEATRKEKDELEDQLEYLRFTPLE